MYYQDISTSLVKKSLNNKGGIIQPHRLSPLASQHYHNYFAASGQGAFERQGQIPIPVLRKVAEKAFLINICINHACRLASPFSRPITNKATKGFSISLKNTNSTITPQQQKKITMLENFFLNCGFNTDNERGSLLRFMKKGIRDLLTVDQITTEIQYRTDGTPFAFWTVDPATIYRHPQDTEDDDIDFIQLIDCVPVAEFTSKQLIFDTMNPRSDIEHSLYGYSYVEQAIELITGMINSFTYNQGNFINDNLPRGAILINGDPDQSSVDLISDYIINMMSDPSQKWRIPVFPSGDENGTIQWVSFQKGNRDMEFTEWTNRLWTSVAALFGTDLEELGIRVNTGTSVIPENPEARIKASKSRVLDDVLRFFQDHFQHILDLIDDNYCFEFIGAEQNDLKLQNECRTNKLSTCYTINEVRQEEGLEPINEEWANIPLNPQLIILHGQMQGEQQPKAESGLNDDDPDDDNPPPNRDDENDEEYKSKHEDTDINAEDVEKSIDTSKCHKEEITDKNGVRRNVWKKNAETEDNTKKLLKENAKKDFNNIEQSLSNGIDFTVNNSKIGEILIEQGSTGKHGYGLKHIIEQRYKKDGKSENEITALLSLIVEAARNGEIVRNNEIIQNGKDIGTYYLEKNGIIAFVSKNKNGTNTQFVITGFDDNEKKEEAADAIKTVIADNSYTQEFIIVKQQVGAVITSLNGTTDKTSVVGGEILNNTSTSDSSISKSIDKSTFTKLDYFKKQLIDILVSQEKEENQNIEKAVKANIGEIRTRKDGFKYKKINNGEWKRIYESESKGAKLSIAAIKRKIDNAKDEEELMNIIMTNKQRFVDKMGFMLPIVQELNKYIDEKEASQRWQIDNKTNTTKGSLSDATDNTANRATKTPHIEKERADATMSKAPEQTSETLHTSTSTLPQDTEKSSLADIKAKYESSKFVTGDNDEIILPDGTTVSGKWKIVEATAPSASHDEQTFHKTSGFPMNADGSTINDRDYEHDIQAQEMVHKIASDYDGRALSMDNPIVVTQDGVVISGNNRTMSSKIAARKGTDAKYIETLAKRCKKYGFSQSDLKNFKNPRVVFETQQNNYSTKEFARFNQSDKKTISPLEQAVKIAKTIDFNTVENIAENINEYETLGEMYQNKDVCSDIFNSLKESGIISDFDLPQYINNGVLTVAGKDFLETVLIGSVINENNLRSLNQDGCKNIRAKLVRAILPLTKNKGLKNGYSVNKELNEAIEIYAEIANEKNIKNVKEYRQQGNFFKAPDPLALAFAEKLEGTQKEFAELMNEMNGSLREAADGQFDMFFGGIESRDDILQRFLNIKKSLRQLKRTARIIIEV